MKCHVHPEAEAQATCTRCGKAVCSDCAVDVGGKVVCRPCLAAASAVAPSQESALSRNPLAIVSVTLAVLGALGCVCGGALGGLLFGVPAAITGYLGRKKALEAGGDQQVTTLAMIGMIGGAAETVLSLLLFLLLGASLGLLAATNNWR